MQSSTLVLEISLNLGELPSSSNGIGMAVDDDAATVESMLEREKSAATSDNKGSKKKRVSIMDIELVRPVVLCLNGKAAMRGLSR